MGKTRRVSGGKVGSIKEAKKELAKRASAQKNRIKSIPQDDDLTVRFLTEPNGFWKYYEYFDSSLGENGLFRMVIEGEDLPDTAGKPTLRYLANCYVVDEQKVMPVKIPATLFELMLKFYDKRGTILDRDYDLSRSGSGKNNTKYTALPGEKEKVNISRFKLLDLEEVLQAQIDDEDDNSDSDLRRKKKNKRRDSDDDDEPRSTKRRRYDDDDDDEDPWSDAMEDDDDDDDDDDEKPRRRSVKKKSKSAPGKKTGTKRKTKTVIRRK